ncbi:MAG: hypothetical protein ACI4DP_13700 [Candidatus Ornithomonoglobus sp.]
MRKFISILSAAALVSSVVVVPISANAEGETVLWSDTFDTYVNSVAHQTKPDDVGNVLVDGTAIQRNTYSGIGGMTLYTTDRADDSSYFQVNPVEEGSTDLYLQTQVTRFSNASRGAYIQFTDTYAAEDGKDVVLAFKVKETNLGETTYDNAFTVGNTMINMDTIGATLDEWHNIKIVVTTTGTSVYLDGGDTAVATSADTSIGTIGFIGYVNGVSLGGSSDAQKANTSHPFGYPTFGFNDMVVYTAADGVSSEVPSAEDREEATPAPTPTAPPPAAEIENTTTIDFDTTDFAAAGVTVTNHKDYTTVSTVTDDETSSTVLSVAQTSEKDNSYAYATFDLSALTAGKTHVIIDYDLKFIGDGRLKVILQDGAIEGGQATALSSGLISQGKTSSSSTPNIVVDEWVHTSVDVDFVTGSGTYEVTKADGTAVGSGNITTDITALTTMSLVSWSPNTSYIDNIVIQTGGEAAKATPEPASELDGSNQTLLPEGATQFDTFANIEGADAASVVNHSFAKPAVADGTASIYNADATIRGKSVYAAYDVLVNIGDSLSLQALGSDPSKIGTTFVLTGNQDGTASASALVDKGDTVNIAGNLVCGTWYRVLIEIPQNSVVVTEDDGNTSNVTNTGNATYTIYRIDAEDQSKVSEAAASGEGLTPRNLSDRAAASFKALVTGTPYIDNGVTFVAEQGLSLLGGIVETPAPSESVATPEPAATVEGSGVNLADGARETIATFAAVEGTAEEVLNHSFAKPAAAGEINALSDNARGNAVYAAYDVLVNAGDKLTLAAVNGSSLGAQFNITGNEDGTATARYIPDSKGEVELDGNLVCGTWYRVVIEIPQDRAISEETGEAYTVTGEATYTIYRIDKADTTKTAGIAAQASGIAARNLYDRGMKSFQVTVEGTPYIDNGVTYLNKSSANTWYRYHYTKDANGVLTDITIETVDDPSKNGPEAGKSYVWNKLMQPYVPAAEETPTE